MSTHSIHHVTAVTGQIEQNLDFYTRVLGLRLVKKSVNQDDIRSYHLFYADGVGTPGTDMTFFDWPDIGGTSLGRGTITRTTFRIPVGSEDFWIDRLSENGITPTREDNALFFQDPEGTHLELVATSDAPKVLPWTEHVPEEQALRGILGVDLWSARPDLTRRVLEEILGYSQTSKGIFEVEHARIRLLDKEGDHLWRIGAGGVHHVAFAVDDDDELLEMKERVERLGLKTSGYVDRFYFHSLYFREPGGILFELATRGPGFASDESLEHLGEKLALPPFLEGRRSAIEAGLRPIGSAATV